MNGFALFSHPECPRLSQVSNGSQGGKTPTVSFKNGSVCALAGAPGPVCAGPGALQVQRGEHDGLSAAQH